MTVAHTAACDYRGHPYWRRNGRAFYRSTGAVMGSWQMDAGLQHGLSVYAIGGSDTTTIIATLVWLPVGKNANE